MWRTTPVPVASRACARADRPPGARGMRSTARITEAITPLMIASRWASRSGAADLARTRPVSKPPSASTPMLRPSGSISVRVIVQAVARRMTASNSTLLQPSAGCSADQMRRGLQRETVGSGAGRARLATEVPLGDESWTGKRRRDGFAVLDEVGGEAGGRQRTDHQQRVRGRAKGGDLEQDR